MTSSEDLCPCCSGLPYRNCCKPLHEGTILASSPLQLMRSRYSAYALNLPEYIILTTHPASPQYMDDKFSWKRSISKFSKNSLFHKLDIIDVKETPKTALVSFTASLSQGGEDASYSERSYFEKIHSKWLYHGGIITESHAPTILTTGQLRLLPIAYYGDPILRKKSSPIPSITSDIKTLIEEMVETMDASRGMGLSAPQIHHSLRLFVMRTPIETSKGLDLGEVQVFINPVLSDVSSERWTATEGCLSIPGIRHPVTRSKSVTITYTALDGTTQTKRCSGWEAKVIFHEYDHLEGVLFIDHLSPRELSKIAFSLKTLEKRLQDGLAL